MKKIILLFNLLMLTSIAFCQDHFDELTKSMSMIKMMKYSNKGIGFDFSDLKNRTLVIPSYSEDLSYNNFVKNNQLNQFETLEDKTDYYNTIWKKGIDESFYKFSSYKIGSLDIESIPEEDYKKYFFVAFNSFMNNDYIVFWALDSKGKELTFNSQFINGLDFGQQEDISIFFNILEENFTSIANYLEGREFLNYEDEKKTYNFLHGYAKEEYVTYACPNFISLADQNIFLIPEEEKSAEVEELLSTWDYSEYKFVPQSFIDEKKAENALGYMYLRTLSPAEGRMGINIMLSTQDNVLLYQNMEYINVVSSYADALRFFKAEIDKMKEVFDPENTIVYGSVKFTHNELPSDLSSSKIAYVNSKKEQYNYSGLINGSFERKMGKYPYAYAIVDEIDAIPSDCKYRVKLKRVYMRYEITYDTDNPLNPEVKNKTREGFILYLEDLETGETYIYNKEPNFYNYLFRDFVKDQNR